MPKINCTNSLVSFRSLRIKSRFCWTQNFKDSINDRQNFMGLIIQFQFQFDVSQFIDSTREASSTCNRINVPRFYDKADGFSLISYSEHSRRLSNAGETFTMHPTPVIYASVSRLRALTSPGIIGNRHLFSPFAKTFHPRSLFRLPINFVVCAWWLVYSWDVLNPKTVPFLFRLQMK